jgi:CRP-like cAMP-binding protein
MRISQADRVSYALAMRRFASLSEADIDDGLALVRVVTFAKKEHFLRAGETAVDVALVLSGLFREHFTTSAGVEKTKAFVCEGQVTGSIADLLAGGPSRAFIVAEEPARALVFSFASFEALAARSAGWEAVRRAVLERVLATKATREWELLGLDARERYAAFAQLYPGLEARVAARHVASYLGITPEHLSRLRRSERLRQASVARPAPRIATGAAPAKTSSSARATRSSRSRR